MNRTRAFLGVAIGGIASIGAGLAVDAVLHARDHGLSVREGVFSLTNPGHVLLLVGILSAAVGVFGAFWSTISGGRAAGLWGHRSARVAFVASAVAASLAIGGVAAWSADRADAADHHGDATADGHTHSGDVHSEHHPQSDVSTATPDQRAAAQTLLDQTRADAAKYSSVAAAEAAGYRAPTNPNGRALHYANASYRRDGRSLDPERPETLVYFDSPTGKVLIGAMYSVPPGTDPPDPGGPITQWHDHLDTCRNTSTGKVQPVNDAGDCPDGFVGGLDRLAPKMMHIWFVNDLALAYSEKLTPQVARALRAEHAPR